MTQEELYSAIFAFIKEHDESGEHTNAQLKPDVSLIEQGLLDSMAMIGLLLNLEQQSGISVDFGSLDAETVVTFDGLKQLFCEK